MRAPVKAAGVVVGRVESVRLDPKTYEAVVSLKHRQRLSVLERHDRLDPDVGPSGRGLHRSRRRRRSADAHRRLQDRQDAIGRRAGEAHRTVPVRQGFERTRPNELHRVCRAALAAALLLSGCASTPGPALRPVRGQQPRDVCDQRAARQVFREADRAGVGRLRAHLRPEGRRATTSTTSTICFRWINGLLQGKLDKAGNDIGRVMINTGFGFAGPDRHRVGRRHSPRQRGFRPDLRVLGHSAGAVPVHPVVGAVHGARRHRLHPAVLVHADAS